jgi:hypothetical protein
MPPIGYNFSKLQKFIPLGALGSRARIEQGCRTYRQTPGLGRKMHFIGTTVLRIQNGKIIQEFGLDDGVKALTQLGLIKGT